MEGGQVHKYRTTLRNACLPGHMPSSCRAVMAQSLILSERLELSLGVSRVRASSQEASGSAL